MVSLRWLWMVALLGCGVPASGVPASEAPTAAPATPAPTPPAPAPPTPDATARGGCRLTSVDGLPVTERRAPTRLAVGASAAVVVHEPSIYGVTYTSSPGWSEHRRSGAIAIARHGAPAVMIAPGSGGAYAPDPRALHVLHVAGEAALLDCEDLGTEAARCTLRAPWSPTFDGRSFAPPREVTSRDHVIAVEHEGVVHVVVFDEALATGHLVHLGATDSEIVAWTPPSTDATFDTSSLERVEGGVRVVLHGARTRSFVLDDLGRVTQPLTELADTSVIDAYLEARRTRGLSTRDCRGASRGDDVLALCTQPSALGPFGGQPLAMWIGWADPSRPDEALALPSPSSGSAAFDVTAHGAALAWESIDGETAALRFAWLDCPQR